MIALPSWLAAATGAFGQQMARDPASFMGGNAAAPTIMDGLRGVGHDMMEHYRGLPQAGPAPQAAPAAAPAPTVDALPLKKLHADGSIEFHPPPKVEPQMPPPGGTQQQPGLPPGVAQGIPISVLAQLFSQR